MRAVQKVLSYILPKFSADPAQAAASSPTTEVCYVAQTVDVELAPGEGFKVDYWFEDHTHDDVLCHFWCNERGDRPIPLPQTGQHAALIETIVSTSLSFVNYTQITSTYCAD